MRSKNDKKTSTIDYHQYLINSLKNPAKARDYFQVAKEDYNEDEDHELFMNTLRDLAEAKGVVIQFEKMIHSHQNSASFFLPPKSSCLDLENLLPQIISLLGVGDEKYWPQPVLTQIGELEESCAVNLDTLIRKVSSIQQARKKDGIYSKVGALIREIGVEIVEKENEIRALENRLVRSRSDDQQTKPETMPSL